MVIFQHKVCSSELYEAQWLRTVMNCNYLCVIKWLKERLKIMSFH